MPGTDERSRARIEDGWKRRGRQDAADGRQPLPPDGWLAGQAAAAGLDIAAAYQRGYESVVAEPRLDAEQ